MNPISGLFIIGTSLQASNISNNHGAEHLANQTGKRYVCGKCGSEFIVTKGGDGSIGCCQTPMELK